MPRSWKALPMPGWPGVMVKAPTHADFLDQEYDGGLFRFRRQEATEFLQATALLYGLTKDARLAPKDGDGTDLIQITQGGPHFEVWRYPKGLACKMPKGWTVYLPFNPADADIDEGPADHEEAAPTKAKGRAKRGDHAPGLDR